MIKRLTHLILAIAASCTLIAAQADVPSWNIVPNQSKLWFTGIQNDAPVSAYFKNFTGNIQFSPTELDKSNVRIEVDMATLAGADIQVIDTLNSADWFNIKVFPKAVFVADKFSQTSDGKYEADGNLTLRDKTLPMKLLFTLKQNNPNQITAQGSGVIKRTAFGVGQKAWSDTNQVKDNVKVEFVVVGQK